MAGDVPEDQLVDIEDAIGGKAVDVITGSVGINRLGGLAGDDYLNGLAGDDRLIGGLGKDVLIGGDGNDVLEGGEGADLLNGGAGQDMASYANANVAVTIDLARGQATSGEAAGDRWDSIEAFLLSNNHDRFLGGTAADEVYGGSGEDNLAGGGGADMLFGNDGADVLNGGDGQDFLEGGAGADRFVFRSAAQSRPTASDRIGDFGHAEADTIDLSGIDANGSRAGNQAFTFLGSVNPSATGSLGYRHSGGQTIIEGEVSSTPGTEVRIVLSGVHILVGDDFIL